MIVVSPYLVDVSCWFLEKFDKNYVFKIDNVAGRGCLSDQLAIDAQKCSGNTSYCTQCSSANCNTATVRSDEKCITCDSTSDARCSQKPLELSSQMCSVSGNGVCFARVTESN